MKRREFVRNTALLSGGVLLSGYDSIPFTHKGLKNIGVQLFSIPKSLEKDFRSGIRMLSKMGYTEVELFGPFPFSAESAKKRWQAITPMLGFEGSGYFGQEASTFKSILKEFKIKATSAHTDLETLQTRMPQLGEAGALIGFEYVGLPAIPEENRTTLDDYKRMAEAFNTIGEAAKKEGLKFAYHNHGYGLKEIEGQIPLNLILEETDPDLVYFEMDIFWTTAGGANPVDYLQSFPNRYKQMHVKDMKEIVHFSGDGGSANEWIELFPHMATAGSGALNLKSIIDTGLKTGVKHFYVEQDMVASPEIALKKSFDYLKSI